MEINKKIPIFPLGVVLLPEMNLPLHIFEERYKTMIAECLNSGKGFGVVLYDGSEIKNSGCLAKITEVTKKYPDGRMDILTRGTERFKILGIDESKPYLQAEISYYTDDDYEDSSISQEKYEEAIDLLKQIAEITRNNPNLFSEKDFSARQLSFIIASIEGFTLEEKQEFLEMQSTSQRLSKGIEALDKLIERIKINEEIKQIIGGNGHLPELLDPPSSSEAT
jgi:ATP-dependent Lon protease